MSVEIKGAEAIRKMVDQLPKRVKGKVIRNANRSAAREVVKIEKLTAPEGPNGNLVDSIGTEAEGRGSDAIIAGPRRKGRYKGYAAHLVEFGTKPRRKKSGAFTGTMPKRPFVQPAFEKALPTMRKVYNEKLGKALVSQMRSIIRRYGA